MDNHDHTVYGEPVADLLAGLVAIHEASTVNADGVYESSLTLRPSVAEPLFRALMRAEAELLVEDAASLGGTASYDSPTHDQRAADALVRLVQAVGEAVAPAPA